MGRVILRLQILARGSKKGSGSNYPSLNTFTLGFTPQHNYPLWAASRAMLPEPKGASGYVQCF
jgi:hypothetical protein